MRHLKFLGVGLLFIGCISGTIYGIDAYPKVFIPIGIIVVAYFLGGIIVTGGKSALPEEEEKQP